MENYLTVLEPFSGEYEEKKSRFIASIYPVKSEEEAFSIIKEIKQKYWDARHNVYAFRLKNDYCRFSDDGEPHSTAGKPILEVIIGNELYDVLIVVTRYFGGILLGTGGLVRAYSEAAKSAIGNSVIAEMGLLREYKTICDYQQYNKLEKLILKNNGIVNETLFEENIVINYCFSDADCNVFSEKIIENFSGSLQMEFVGEKSAPINFKK